MSNLIVFESLAVFAIWMQRKGRWSAFLAGLTGTVVVAGAGRAGTSPAYTEDKNGVIHSTGAVAGTSGGSSSTGSGSQPPAGSGLSQQQWNALSPTQQHDIINEIQGHPNQQDPYYPLPNLNPQPSNPGNPLQD